MAIVQSVRDAYQFERAFSAAGRKDQFSYNGLHALFEYLDDLSDDIGEDIEMDVVALCCEWSEYESLEAYCLDYGAEYESLDDLRDHTEVIEFDGGIIVAAH